jgi:hypothetical protein
VSGVARNWGGLNAGFSPFYDPAAPRRVRLRYFSRDPRRIDFDWEDVMPILVQERAVYNEDSGRWYKQNECQMVSTGVQADSYPEAFERLYGHAPFMPPPERSKPKEVTE